MTTERKSGRTWVWIRKRERGPFSWPGAAGGGVGGTTPAPLEGLLSLRSREPTKTLKGSGWVTPLAGFQE